MKQAHRRARVRREPHQPVLARGAAALGAELEQRGAVPVRRAAVPAGQECSPGGVEARRRADPHRGTEESQVQRSYASSGYGEIARCQLFSGVKRCVLRSY